MPTRRACGMAFIGPIQSNKTALIAERFAGAQLEREKDRGSPNAARPGATDALEVCIKLTSREGRKSGCSRRTGARTRRCIANLQRVPCAPHGNPNHLRTLPFNAAACASPALRRGHREAARSNLVDGHVG